MFSLIIYGIIEIILLLFCIPLGFFEIFLSKKIDSDLQKRKIIFLHGWLHRNPIYFLLKRRLQSLGYSVIMPDFGWHTNDIAKIVQRLEEFISDNSLQDFILMGHSIGGVIALAYYKKNYNKINKLIAFGSPFGGSSWVIPFSFFSLSAEQVVPGSVFLKKLLSDMNISKGNIFCLFARHDEVVSSQSAQLPFAKNIEADAIGHMSLIYSKSVLKSLQKIL